MISEKNQAAMFGMTLADLQNELGPNPDPMQLLSLLSDAQEILSMIRPADQGTVDQINRVRQLINCAKYGIDQLPRERK